MSDARAPRLIKLPPGGLYVTRRDEVIATLLGSCVSACIRDPVCGIGGMNHFLLPVEGAHSSVRWQDSEAGRYGSYAMERLINEILEGGGQRTRLEVKIFGGSSLRESLMNVGSNNAAFVEEYLRLEGMEPLARDLGGYNPRRVHYHPRTGRVLLKRLRAPAVASVVRREQVLLAMLRRRRPAGCVELF